MSAIDRLDRLTSDRCDVRAILAAVDVGKLMMCVVSKEYEKGKRLYDTIINAVYELEDERDRLDTEIARIGPEAERENEQYHSEQNRAYIAAVRG